MNRLADLRMERVAQAAAWAAAVVALAATVYSYAQVRWVSEQLHPAWPWLSWIFPVIVDVPLLILSMLAVAMHDRPQRRLRAYVWGLLGFFASLSWLSNCLHGLQDSALADLAPGGWGTALTVLVSGFPTLGLVAGPHIAVFALRHSQAATAPPWADQPALPLATVDYVLAPDPEGLDPAHEHPMGDDQFDGVPLAPPRPLVFQGYPVETPPLLSTAVDNPVDETPQAAAADPVPAAGTVKDQAWAAYVRLRDATPDEVPTLSRLMSEVPGLAKSSASRWRPEFDQRYASLQAGHPSLRLVGADTPSGAQDLR